MFIRVDQNSKLKTKTPPPPSQPSPSITTKKSTSIHVNYYDTHVQFNLKLIVDA